MRVTIKDIRHPLFPDRINETSKMVVIEEINFDRPIKILVGQTYLTFNRAGEVLAIRSPNQAVYEADLVISCDILCRHFSIIKNRYGVNTSNINNDYFLNNYLKRLMIQLGIDDIYYQTLVISHIIQVISTITGEAIYFLNGTWKITGDTYINKVDFIKYKPLKHNFSKF